MSETTPLPPGPVDETLAEDESVVAVRRQTEAYGMQAPSGVENGPAVPLERPTLVLKRALVSRAPERRTEILRAFVGTTIDGRYRIDALLATGGMGAVFRARHLGLDRDIALKMLHPELTSDPTSVKRFQREAQSSSIIDHPNCVRVTDYGVTSEGITFLVMELIDGDTLDSILGRPLAPALAVDLITQVLEGLDAAHHQGVVHRDLKPDNILVARDHRGRETLKLVDFGIAKLMEGGETKTRLTKTGFIFGTPRYMSPEQAMGETITVRTDQYAVGLIFFEMLAGRRPFAANDTPSLIEAHVTKRHDPLPPDVPAGLVPIVDRLLAKEPGLRFPDARAVIETLRQVRPSLDGLVPALPSAAPVVDDELDETGVVAPRETQPNAQARQRTAETKAVPPPTALHHEPAPSSNRFALGVIGGMLIVGVLVGGGYAVLGNRSVETATTEPETAPELAEEAEPTPKVEPEPQPEPAAEEPAPAPTVALRLDTNVPASVVDAASGEVYGSTSDENGLQLPRSENGLDLLLRADGYEELSINVVPASDQELSFELAPVRGKRRAQGKAKKAKTPDAPAEQPENEKKKSDEEFMQLDGVVDPFKKK